MIAPLDPSASILPEIELDVSLAAGADATWEVLEASIREELSSPYEARLLLATDDPFPSLPRLLGSTVTLRIRRDELLRQLHGVVRAAEDVDRHRDGRAMVRLVVVPELWFLSRRRDSRIFAHETTPGIVRAVLDAAGLYAGSRLQLQLHAGEPTVHSVREHCVQHDETDLDFVRRLLEEEGTTFYFRHDEEGGETLVLADGERAELSGTYVPVDNGFSGQDVRLVTTDRLQTESVQTVQRFQEHVEVQSTSATLRELDFSNYRHRELWTAEQRTRADRELPVYEQPGRLVMLGDGADVAGGGSTIIDRILGELRGASEGLLRSSGGDSVGDMVRAAIPALPQPPLPRHTGNTGSGLARIRLEESQGRARVYTGSGVVAGFCPGHVFRLVDHPRNDLDQPYLLTRVEHDISAVAWAPEGQPRYVNRFACVPRSVPFRPARTTPRPRIHGTQTATVVGGPTEEMHVDPYGRVRVQFHWDRQHRLDENLDSGGLGNPRTVCWVRCAQAWAGPSWGAVFIPRVGMEVVVTFLEGDPDRPLVVGCVYNSANPPPYSLPSNYHRSTIMSRSIPASTTSTRVGFNELRFDDLQGREQIYVHAEKDLTEVVRQHHETYVGGSHDVEVRHDQTNHVAGTQQEGIGQDQLVSVGRQQALIVALNREVRVGGVEERVATRGRLTSASGFDGEVVQGYHLHYVLPPGAAGTESRPEIAALLGVAHSTAEQVARDAGDDTAGEGSPEDDADPGDTPSDDQSSADDSDPGPLEIYVVEGERRKRVVGTERIEVNERRTSISGDDHLTVDGSLLVTANMVGVASVGGTDKGLALHPPDEDRLRLFRGGGQELVMSGDGVRLADGPDRTLEMSSDHGVHLICKDGPLVVSEGPASAAAGIAIVDQEVTIYAKAADTFIEIKEKKIKVEAVEEIFLKSNGGGQIKLKSDGSIEIRGTKVDVYGPLTTH